MSAICAARHSACTGQLPHFVFPFLIFSQCSRFLPSRPIKYGSSSRLQAACPIHADRGAGLYPPRISRSVYTAGLTPFFICPRIASVAGVGFLGCSRVISFFSFAIQNVGFCIIPHHCYFTKHKQNAWLLIALPHCSAPPDVPPLGFGCAPLLAIGLGCATPYIASRNDALIAPQRKEQTLSRHWALSTVFAPLGF